MDATLVYVVYFWIVCAICGAIIGSAKEAGGAGFALGLFLGPLGVLAAFAMDGRSTCHQCAGRLNSGAKVCHHCGATIVSPVDALPQQSLSDAETEARIAERLRHKRGLPPRR